MKDEGNFRILLNFPEGNHSDVKYYFYLSGFEYDTNEECKLIPKNIRGRGCRVRFFFILIYNNAQCHF